MGSLAATHSYVHVTHLKQKYLCGESLSIHVQEKKP